MRYRTVAVTLTLAAAGGIAAFALASVATRHSTAAPAADANGWTHSATAWGDPDSRESGDTNRRLRSNGLSGLRDGNS